MSLNNIDLSARLVAQLYPRSLSLDNTRVHLPAAIPAQKEVQTTVATPAAPPAREWKSLGNNQSRIMVVVNYPDHLHLPDAAFEFLSQMLNACKLGPADVAIVNNNNYPGSSHQELLDHFQSKTVLLFGTTASVFGFPFETPQYQVQNFAGLTVMHAPALDELKDDKPAKIQLWASFKKIFDL